MPLIQQQRMLGTMCLSDWFWPSSNVCGWFEPSCYHREMVFSVFLDLVRLVHECGMVLTLPEQQHQSFATRPRVTTQL